MCGSPARQCGTSGQCEDGPWFVGCTHGCIECVIGFMGKGRFEVTTISARAVAVWASPEVEAQMADAEVGIGGVLLEQVNAFRALGCHQWDLISKINGQKATEHEYNKLLHCLKDGVECPVSISLICPHDGARWSVEARIVKRAPDAVTTLEEQP